MTPTGLRRSVLAGAFGLLVAVVVSCSTEPTSTEAMRSLKTTEEAPEPDAAMASRSGKSLEQIGLGYSVFQRKCLECHEARVPKNPKDPNWHPIMSGMSYNAGLSESEQAAMAAYLEAAAR